MPDPPDNPTRILHVIAGMNRGGIETWLMHILRNVDRDRFQMDFAVNQDGVFDEEIRSLGSRIHRCVSPKRLRSYQRSLSEILAIQGPYDVVHSHLYHFSGIVLRCAAQAYVPVRIAHGHVDQSARGTKPGLMRRGYLQLMKRLIKRHATCGLACTERAAADLYGPHWASDHRWRVHRYSMPFSEFRYSSDERRRLRAELGIASTAFVLGHVGRFFEQKNHPFVVDTFAAAARRNPELNLLLVGDGPLRVSIEQQVSRLGMQGRVIFAGVRGDVPQLMTSVMDGFLFPSLYEGSPLALVEAQAAGLPCLVSERIDEIAVVVDDLVARQSLADPPAAWVRRVEEMPQVRKRVAREVAHQQVADSPFHIQRGAVELASIYFDEMSRVSHPSTMSNLRAAVI